MIKQLIATVLASASLLSAQPAHAYNGPAAPLFYALDSAQVRRQSDTFECNEPGLLGFYEPMSHRVVLCFENIAKTNIHPGKVLIHESIHVAQRCLGGPVLPHEDYTERAAAELGMSKEYYPKELLQTEAEARVLTEVLDFNETARLIRSSCNT